MEFVVFFLFFMWLMYTDFFRDGYDDTDQPEEEGMKRSGSDLHIKYDYGTGLQYIVAPFGGITPRLDADGNHMKILEEDLVRKPESKFWRYAFVAFLIVAVAFFGVVV